MLSAERELRWLFTEKKEMGSLGKEDDHESKLGLAAEDDEEHENGGHDMQAISPHSATDTRFQQPTSSSL